MHINDWIEIPGSNESENYAKFVFDYFIKPAWMQYAFHTWMKRYVLFCTYEGVRYRVTGASGMGDIWLTTNFEQDFGYEERVDVEECSEWSNVSNPINLELIYENSTSI